jgi:uncharacterized membrane protein
MMTVSENRSGRTIQWLFGLLALAGIGIAAYLLSVHLRGTEPYCSSYGGCETVNDSKYAVLLGVPIAGYGLLAYVAIFALVLVKQWIRPAFTPYATLGIFLVALMGFLFSIYLTALEAFVIHAFCLWCLGSFAVTTAVFVLSIVTLSRERVFS